MKKHLLSFSIVFLVLGISAGYGQATFGIKAGANIANANFDTGTSFTIKPDALFGFYAGPTARFDIASGFAVQPELLLSLQGFKLNDTELLGEELDMTSKNLYLNLPVMVRFSATDALYLEAGPQVGMLLSSKFEFEGISADTDAENDVDFGLNLGAGYLLPVGLSIEARYNFGLVNAYGDTEDAEDDNVLVTNRVFSFGLGYTF